MTAQQHYITTSIPYVNARPHLGFALEIVQADTLAPHHRHRGDQVRSLSGTDGNSLKNALAAEAEGIDVQALVDRNAEAFAALRGPLALSLDDFIRTSSDPRHRIGVERLWRQCGAAGDLCRKEYEGLYCVGCEQFYTEDELVDRQCAEHGTEPELVTEENWFFRLSRHADRLHDLITGGALRIEPAARRNDCPRPDRERTARLLRLPFPQQRPWLGHPRARRLLPSRLRVVERAGQPRHQPRLRHRRLPVPGRANSSAMTST
jgi:methionyl-tRNA synthetase